MSKLFLRQQSQDGRRTDFPLSLNHISHLKVEPGATYSVIDATTQQPPSSLKLKREDDDLEIEINDELLVKLEAFYQEDIAAVYQDEALLLAADAEAETDTSAITADDDETAGLSPWAWAGIGVGAASIAVIASDDDSSSAPPPAAYTVTIAPASGPFQTVERVELYDQNGNLLVSQEHDFSTGPVVLTISNGYAGPILAKIIDSNGAEGDYLDETSNTLISLGEPLRAMALADGNSDIVISITPLTELAVREAGITNNTVSIEDLASNAQVAALFGVTDILAPVITVVDSAYDSNDGLSAAEEYGNVLALLSGVDSITGSIDATLNQLQSAITEESDGSLSINQAGDDLFASGLTAFEVGENATKAQLNTALSQVDDTPPPAAVISSSSQGNATPTFSGTAESNGTVVVSFADDTTTIQYTVVADETGAWNVDASVADDNGNTPALSDGNNYSVDAVVTDPSGNSSSTTTQSIVVDAVAPSTTISVIDISDDTGSSNTDFLTKFATQTVTAILNTTLAAGETLMGSVDGGSTFSDITAMVSETAITWTGVTLSAASSLQLKVTDTAGNDGPVANQAYTLDTTAPTNAIGSIAISQDSGSSVSDFVTSTALQTITATLSSTLAVGEVLYGSVDGGSNFTDITAMVSGTGLSWSDVTLSGSSSIQFKITDAAGNDGDLASQLYTLDTNAPSIATLLVSSDDVVNTSDTLTAVTFSGTTSGVEDNQMITVVIGGISIDVTVTNNAFSGTANLSGVTDGSSIAVTGDVSDSAGNAAPQFTNTITKDVSAPVISAVSIPDAAMNIGDVVTVTLTVADDGGDTYSNLSGTVGGFALSNLNRTGPTSYTAQFTVSKGGTDVAAGSDIPVSLTLDDTAGNTSATFATPISQASDGIDASEPSVTDANISISGASGTGGAFKVG
ncbi:MAG: hypothetical protein HRU20_10355, partial [Pseudomonadales bacterium]|nr:hypothetical protein [Pseudomonadales bacterium]